MNRLLWHGHQVMYRQLAVWMVYGLLQDQHGEFFISRYKHLHSASHLQFTWVSFNLFYSNYGVLYKNEQLSNKCFIHDPFFIQWILMHINFRFSDGNKFSGREYFKVKIEDMNGKTDADLADWHSAFHILEVRDLVGLSRGHSVEIVLSHANSHNVH